MVTGLKVHITELITLLIFTPAFAFHDIWQYPDKQTKSNSRVAINFFFMA
jgi:hypothetical protein